MRVGWHDTATNAPIPVITVSGSIVLQGIRIMMFLEKAACMVLLVNAIWTMPISIIRKSSKMLV